MSFFYFKKLILLLSKENIQNDKNIQNHTNPKLLLCFVFKAFSAFDKTGDGVIPQTEFRQVLDHFCMRLSEVQFKKLLSELRINEGEEIMVDWKEFLHVFNLHKQEVRSVL